MGKATVTKASIRKLVRRNRLPRYFRMFVAGCWLYNVLEANGLEKKHHLWQMSYWVSVSSLDARLSTITWRS